jgi:hypothetical protein
MARPRVGGDGFCPSLLWRSNEVQQPRPVRSAMTYT